MIFLQKISDKVFNIVLPNRCASRLCYENIFRRFSSRPGNITPIKMAYKLFGEEKGDGAPVIILHGLFTTKEKWSRLGKEIHNRTQKQVYVVDVRNHGGSPNSIDHSYFHVAEDIKLFLYDHKIEKVALIGHSMGGRAIMVFALENKVYVESLTVVDISPNADKDVGISRLNHVFEKMKTIDFSEGSNLKEVRSHAESKLATLLASDMLAKYLVSNIIEKSKGTFGWKMNVDDLQKAYNEHLKYFPEMKTQFNGPTFFVFGARSFFVDFVTVPDIRVLFPQFTFVTIENSGHWVQKDKPDEFLYHVCKFINDSKSLGK